MRKRRLIFGGVALILLAFLLIAAVPRLRHAIFGNSTAGPPTGRRGYSPGLGLGALTAAPIGGDDWAGKGPLLPGIDFCSYFSCSSGADDFVFFAWGDFNGGAGGTQTFNVKDGLKFDGHLLDNSGQRRVALAGWTKDGRAGRATINGWEFDLAEGSLFLVSARRGYEVKQLKRDLSRYRDADELFRELRKNDHDVVDFFGRTVEAK